MAEGVGVSDEQLDQWENYRLGVGFAGLGMREQRALLGEVRASHAREAELREAFQQASDSADEWSARESVLQQRIDKALVALEETVQYDRQPTMDCTSTDALYNQFTGYLERVEQSWARQATAVRAALTDAGNQPIEETP